MIIKGSVEDIIYRSEESGYTVITFDYQGTLVDCVGLFPSIGEGEMLELTGEFKLNPKFGEQFCVTNVEFLRPSDEESIIKYLSGGLFCGVGESTARAMVDTFGVYTLEIIEKSPSRLTEVVGIGRKKAADIVQSYQETRKMQESLLFLQKCGLSTAMSLRVYKIYDEATVAMITENPYRLVSDVEGIGFLTADKVAEKLGIEKQSEFRLMAGIVFTLQEASGRSGHTCLPRSTLVDEAKKLLDYPDAERLSKIIESMPYQVKINEFDGEELVSLSVNYYTENSIASRLVGLKKNCRALEIDEEKEIRQYELTNGIELHEMQKQAIRATLNEGVTIITGGPGTGKTTIIKCITTLFSQRGMKVALTAPTGRASKRMSEATGENAKTLHRLLNIKKGELPSEVTPLDFDVVIIDEISMADIYIFNTLLKALQLGTRLILVGDKDQLPSVSCGNILADAINVKIFPTVFLTEIYRQAKESMIIVNAHRINRGELPIYKKDSDFLMDRERNGEDIVRSVITMVESRIPKYLNLPQSEIQVLSPMKKGIVGVENLNLRLQNALNPSGAELKYNGTVFRLGDKVMHTVNNYDLEWQRRNGFYIEKGNGVFNGDIGYVIDVKDGELTVEFDDGKQSRYSGGALEELMLAYCISVHKSQGCEFRVAIIVVSGGNYAIMTRNLLYTAVSRAKGLAVIVGDEDNVAKMVANNYTARRYSLLKNLILKAEEKYGKLWDGK